jgi:integrase
MPRKAAEPQMIRRAQPGGAVSAVVYLRDAASRRRHGITLGPWGSPEAREAYQRVLAGWHAQGQRVGRRQHDPAGPTVADLIAAYREEHVETYGYSQSEINSIRGACRLWRQLYGILPVAAFDAKALAAVRAAMIAGDAAAGRQPWCRTTISRQTQRIVAVLKWGVHRGMVPGAIYDQCRTLPPIRRGRGLAAEPEPVRPARPEVVDAIRPHCGPVVHVMLQVQMLTGMRPGELVIMRGADIDMQGPVWIYTPASHKNAWRGQSRTVAIGPKAQAIIRPFLQPGYLFRPARCRMGKVGDHYATSSYCRAVQRACQRAKVEPISPMMARHYHATAMRRHVDPDTVRTLLGQRSLRATEIYSEQDRDKAAAAAARWG